MAYFDLVYNILDIYRLKDFTKTEFAQSNNYLYCQKMSRDILVFKTYEKP